MQASNIRHPSDPVLGDKLQLCRTAADYAVSFSDMAAAAGISKTAMHDLATANRWPKTTDAEGIKAALCKLFSERGATADQVSLLFWRHLGRKREQAITNAYGHLPDYVPPPQQQRAIPEPPQPKATDMLLAKQTLTYQASKAFTLFVNPFDGEVTSTEDLFANGELRFVREAMWQCGKVGRFLAVIGESGAGKSTLKGDMEDRIQRDRAPIVVIHPKSVISMTETEAGGRTLKVNDIVLAIIMAIDPHAVVPSTVEARTSKMLKLIEESAKVGNGHLLVLEEAHKLSVPTIQALKRLHENCRVGRRPALGILMLAQPELRSKLNERRADLREVVQRCEVVTLPPLDGDLKDYLTHRARAAGKNLAELIDDSGIEALRTRLTVAGQDRKATPISLVYPLAVNNLMTAALNVAAELGAPIVNKDVVREI